MKAIEIKDETLHLTARDKPEIKDGDVLIKVHAAGLNRPDLMQRLGKYPPPAGVTDIPGLEVAGTIIESRNPDWQEGDEVCALLTGGGYAEYAAVHGGQCLPVPDGFSMIEAAALPETFFTVWNNLFMRGALKAGEIALIHGGSSGIGTTAIQMAKAWGARVIITAGTDEKCDACLKLGADHAINYKTQDFEEEVKALYPEGIDVVLDMVGGTYVPKNMAVLGTDGRHVNIAHLGGNKAEIKLREIMMKRLVLTGSTLRPRSIEEKTALRDGLRVKIWPFLRDGKIRPQIYQTFPLEKAMDAHNLLEDGNHIGKIVLEIS